MGHIKGTYSLQEKEGKEREKGRKKEKSYNKSHLRCSCESQRLSEWTIDDTKSAIAMKPMEERD